MGIISYNQYFKNKKCTDGFYEGMDAGSLNLSSFLFSLSRNLALENCLSFLKGVNLVEPLSMRSCPEELQGQDPRSTCFFLRSLCSMCHGKNQHVSPAPRILTYTSDPTSFVKSKLFTE